MEMENIIRSKISEYRTLEVQMQDATNQLEAMEQAKQQMESTIQSIQNIPSGNEKTILPIGSGVFTQVQISQPLKFSVQIGGSILVEKDSKQTIDFLNKKLSELQKVYNYLKTQTDRIYHSMSSLENEINSLSRNSQ